MTTNDKPRTPRGRKMQTNKASTTKPRRMAREPKAPAEDAADAGPLAAAGELMPTAPAEPTTAIPPRPSKQAIVLELLRRAEGASLDELIAATGWLPHSTRAALTGLRKKGHAIERSKTDERTSYRIAGGEG